MNSSANRNGEVRGQDLRSRDNVWEIEVKMTFVWLVHTNYDFGFLWRAVLSLVYTLSIRGNQVTGNPANSTESRDDFISLALRNGVPFKAPLTCSRINRGPSTLLCSALLVEGVVLDMCLLKINDCVRWDIYEDRKDKNGLLMPKEQNFVARCGCRTRSKDCPPG